MSLFVLKYDITITLGIILNSKESALELRWERVEERKEMKVVSLVDLSTILLGNATRILAEMVFH